MIYDMYSILLGDDEQEHVILDMALEDFDDETWRVEYAIEQESDTLVQNDFECADSVLGDFKICSDGNDVPRWVRVLAMRMRQRAENMLRGLAPEPVREWAQVEGEAA
jgi:hypothetical protein